jgi:hypothetical protein
MRNTGILVQIPYNEECDMAHAEGHEPLWTPFQFRPHPDDTLA